MFFNRDVFFKTIPPVQRQALADVRLHEEIDSTSTALMGLVTGGAAPGTVVIAAKQTGGRGRSGNTWHSEHQQNLYISYVIEICGDIAQRLPLVPLAAGIAAFEALATEGIVDVLLKWPNDLLLRDKKVGGILCETPGVDDERALAVVGMGINIGVQDFPEELSSIASYVTPVRDARYFRERLSAKWIDSLNRWCEKIQSDSVAELIARWKQCCEPFGRHVRVGTITGYTLDLNESGRLLLKTDAGETCEIPGGMVEHID